MNLPPDEASCLALAKTLWAELVQKSLARRRERLESVMRGGGISGLGMAGITTEVLSIHSDASTNMSDTKDQEMDAIRLLSDTIADRIFAAVPDDPDCREAFDKWRALNEQIFSSHDPSPRSLREEESAAFKTLMAELSLAGVTKF